MVTKSEVSVWAFGHPDDPDEEVGYLEEGEPVLFLGETCFWPDDVSVSYGGHHMLWCLTRVGVGWINDTSLEEAKS